MAAPSSTGRNQEINTSAEPGPASQSSPVFGQSVRSFLQELGREIDAVLASIVEAATQLRNESSEGTELAAQIHEHGEKLRWTLRSVRRLAALRDNSAELEPEVVNAEETVQALLDRFTAWGRTQGVSLTVETSEAPVTLTTDADALRRALRPLLANAVMFTPDGEVEVQIDAADEWVECRVRDTGIGLPAEGPEALFAPFYQQIPEGESHPGGIGMGLPLARAFARCLGGTVEAEAIPDGGSAFTLRVPRDLSAVEVGDHRPAEEQKRSRVLIVEDNDVTHRLLCRMLEEEYRVDVASKAGEGIQKAADRVYDAFILDVNLKGRRTGIEVLHAVRRMGAYDSVPVVACTAHGLDDHQDNFLQAGFDQVVGKPVTKRALLQALDRAFEQPESSDASEPVVSLSGIDLPPLPSTLVTIAGLPSSDPDEGDIETLTRTLEKDQVISQWVLHHINSAYYGMRKSVGTVERAVRYLGFRPVCNLVLTRVIGESFSGTDVPEAGQVQQCVMRTSTMAAFIAREMAEKLDLDAPAMAYTGGMFAQIGRLVLLEVEGEAYVDLWFEDTNSEPSFLGPPPQGQEILRFGEDYVQNGLAVGKTCGLSGDVLSVLQGHTRPTKVRDQFQPLVPIVALALKGAQLTGEAEEEESKGARQVAEGVRKLPLTRHLAGRQAVAERALAAEIAETVGDAREFAGDLLD